MNDLLIYLVKSAGLLSVFYLVYQFLLQKDTAFVQNRKFLLSGIFIAAILPAITFTRQTAIQVPVYFAQFQSFAATENTMPAESAFDWWQLAGIIYFGVFGILIVKYFFQLFSITKLIADSRKIKFENYHGIETHIKTNPFSFFNVIVFNPDLHSAEELQLILNHEKVHARQKHSLDILLVNLVTVLLWFNPLSWMYKKAIEQNLEFLADCEAANSTGSKTAYQKALLKATVNNLTPALSNNFHRSSIKKRIIMLNKKSTSKNNFWKIASVLPALLAFMLIFSCSNTSGSPKNLEVSPENKLVNPIQEKDPLIVVNGEIQKDNFNINSIPPVNIASVDVLKGKSATTIYGEKSKDGVILIALKNGEKTGTSNEESKGVNIAKENHAKNKQATDALLVVDGKIMTKNFKMNSINPDDIESIHVLKGKSAINKYDEKGEKGAIEITLKKD